MTFDPRERLIVALDVSTTAAAQKMVAAVGDSALYFKVGKQLFTAVGPQIVRDLISTGKRVFLDLKFHDIPNTVAAAVREAGRLGASMVTVHASGGSTMLQAAADAAREFASASASGGLTVLAVTVLTSMNATDLAEIGVGTGSTIPDGTIAPNVVQQQVLRLAALALASGCGGIVASAHEATAIRADMVPKYGNNFAIVTPGVRPTGTAHGDQARVVTPAQALAAGATHIVVGRPITNAADPGAAARAIVAEMAAP